MTDSIGNYRQYQMADSCVYETLDYGDSTLIVKTICAPICNSVAGVYDSNGKKLRTIPGTGILPYATIKDGMIVWEDRGIELLDEEERKTNND